MSESVHQREISLHRISRAGANYERLAKQGNMRHASFTAGMYRAEEAGEGKRGSDPVRERSHGNLLSRARAFAELARYETYAFLFACSLSSKNRPHPRRVACQ